MNKVYACSDLHGCLDLWNLISDYCDDTDIIYFLGDAADRERHGLKLIQTLLCDPRVKYIKGNHEDIFVLVGSEMLEGIDLHFNLWIANGGYCTMTDFSNMEDEQQKKILKELQQLPLTAEYVNAQGIKIKMSHSGWFPKKDSKLKEEEIKEYFLWDRSHFNLFPVEEENTIIVHGHTPVPSLDHYKWNESPIKVDEVFFYDNNTKIDIDIGSFYSDKAALIDLDTFEVKYFQTEEDNDKYE